MFANQANTIVNYTGDTNDANAGAIDTTAEPPSNQGKDLTAELKTFYSKSLLRDAKPYLVHDQFGEKKPIPRGSGKNIEFRKFSKLPKATNPITEGVTPQGKKMSVSTITARVEQYGDYIETTDQIQVAAIDNIVVEATEELSVQAGVTLDTITRDEINSGTNRFFSRKYSGGSYSDVTSRADITGECPLTVKDVFKAATMLKKMNAPKFGDSYVAIINPMMSNALMMDAGTQWIDITKYAQPGNFLTGEIGKVGGVRFVESTEAKVFGPPAIRDGLTRLTVSSNASSSATTVYVSEELTTGSGLSIPVYINGVSNTITAIAKGTDAHSDEYALTVTALSASITAGAVICGRSSNANAPACGKDGSAVFSTLFLAKGAYGVTDLEGMGLEHIVKPLGYGNDPLNQRASVGWKAMKTAKILHDEYIVRVESGSAEFSASAESN